MSNINHKSLELSQALSISEPIDVNAFIDTSRLFVQCSGILGGTFSIEQQGITTGWQKFPISISNQSALIISENIAGIEIRTTRFMKIRFVGEGIVDPEMIKIDIYC